MKTRAILFTAADQVGLGEIDVPDPIGRELLIEAVYTVISPGTELRTLAGRQHDMPPFPVIPGYSHLGRVVARGAQATKIEVGTLVFVPGGQTRYAGPGKMWGAHAGHLLYDENSVFPIPAGVDPLQAVLLKLAAIAQRGVALAAPQPGESVAVVGLGLIGQLACRTHRLRAGRVVAVDVSPARVEQARRAGIDAAVVTTNVEAAIKSILPDGADVVVDSTGVAKVLPDSARAVRIPPWGDHAIPTPRLIVQGSYPDTFTLGYIEPFFRELAILFPRDQRPADIRTVLAHLVDKTLDLSGIIAGTLTPTDAPRAYATLQDRTSAALTFAFDWQ